MKTRILVPFVILISSFTLIAQPENDQSELPMYKQGSVAPVKVLTWNIFMRPSFLFWNGQMKRAEAIGDILKNGEYDIILFQESFGKKSRSVLREALKTAYPYEIEPSKKGAVTNNGLWILSKHQILSFESIFFTDCKAGDCNSSKGAVLFEVTIGEQVYQFVNTHVQAEDGKKFAQVRQNQFRMISDLLTKHRKPNVPQFILGDLNTDRKNGTEYLPMLQLLNASDHQISIPEGATLSSTEPATWGCKNNDLIKKKWKGNVQLLDYALQRETGYPFKLRRELKTYTKQWSKKRKHLSDHYAISLTVLP